MHRYLSLLSRTRVYFQPFFTEFGLLFKHCIHQLENRGQHLRQILRKVLLQDQADPLPGRQQILLLRVNMRQLVLLDLEHLLNKKAKYRLKSFLSDSMRHQCDAFNDLASQLPVRRAGVGGQHLQQKVCALGIILFEMFLCRLRSGGNGRNNGFLYNADSILEFFEALHDYFVEVKVSKFLVHALDKVSDRGGSVTLNSGDGIIHQSNEDWKDALMELFLKFDHIVSYLPDAMAHRIAYLRILIADVAHHQIDDWHNLVDVFDVFAHLGQCHYGGMLVAPVRLHQHFLHD